MTLKSVSDSRQAGGLNALKNNSTLSGCETPHRPYMKATDNERKTVYYIRPDCKSWSCPYCARNRANLWRFYASYGGDLLLANGSKLMFVTLTSHELVRSLTAGLAVWRSAWPKISAKMRRRSDGMQYLYVPELTPAGSFHVHLITSCELKTRWYKDNARAAGLGHQAKAVAIASGVECGGYCTKYLTKAIALQGWPKHTRRVNKSQGWPRPPKVETPYNWSCVGSDILSVKASVRAYARHGWQVVTKLELFDTSPLLVT